MPVLDERVAAWSKQHSTVVNTQASCVLSRRAGTLHLY